MKTSFAFALLALLCAPAHAIEIRAVGVPTLDEVGMVGLVALVGVVGGYLARRRKK